MVQNAVERRQQGRRALDDALHRATNEDLAADRQQILGGRIQVADGQILVEQNDRRRQQVEPTEGICGISGMVYGGKTAGTHAR
jgi:hypothetical protein